VQNYMTMEEDKMLQWSFVHTKRGSFCCTNCRIEIAPNRGVASKQNLHVPGSQNMNL